MKKTNPAIKEMNEKFIENRKNIKKQKEILKIHNKMQEDIDFYRDYALNMENELSGALEENKELKKENNILQSRVNESFSCSGNESDNNELSDMEKFLIAETLKSSLKNMSEDTLRYKAVTKYINTLETKEDIKHKWCENFKRVLAKSAKSSSFIKEMERVGFINVPGKGHLKFYYKDDRNITITVAGTPSDHRTMENIYHDAVKQIWG